MTLIDTHAHLYEEAFADDRDAMIERALAAGVQKILIPNVDTTTIEGMLAICEKYPQHIFPMIGLHPCYVKPETWEQELASIKNMLDQRQFQAIGEIGIDLYWDKTTYDIQREAFQIQLDWAIGKNLPIAVHSRDSLTELIELCRSRKNNLPRGVFHCFTGQYEEAIALIDLGFYLGIGGVVTYKNTHLRDVLAKISPEYLVLETDAPYLPPVPHRGKRNESAYTKLVAETLSTVYQRPADAIAAMTTANAEKLFGI